MKVTYDKHYQTEDLFGDPYPELIEFFSTYPKRGKVIDLGCGQGRNAMALARLGYMVTGLDNSKVGIDQMNSKSEKEGLHISGLVGDLYSFDRFQDFDIVILDSIFHFEKQDKKQETALIKNILNRIIRDTVICICIQDSGIKTKILKNTIDSSGIAYEVLNDSTLIYKYQDEVSGHKSETKYCMYIVKRK